MMSIPIPFIQAQVIYTTNDFTQSPKIEVIDSRQTLNEIFNNLSWPEHATMAEIKCSTVRNT